MRGATLASLSLGRIKLFQSTLPVRGATYSPSWYIGQTGISIHAPREGSDNRKVKRNTLTKISIHAPREGSDWQINTY